MTKYITLALLLISSTTMAAAAPTELTTKAKTITIYSAKSVVVKELGKPSHVYLPSDFKTFGLDGTPGLAYVLLWENLPCRAVEVHFNAQHKAIGWNEGRSCPVDPFPAVKPMPAKYSCNDKWRGKFCQ